MRLRVTFDVVETFQATVDLDEQFWGELADPDDRNLAALTEALNSATRSRVSGEYRDVRLEPVQ